MNVLTQKKHEIRTLFYFNINQSNVTPLVLFKHRLAVNVIIIIIIFITYTPGTNKHTHEKNKIFK